MDDFHEPVANHMRPSTLSILIANTKNSIGNIPLPITFTILLTPLLLVIATRFMSERRSEKRVKNHKDGRTVWMPAYWVPGLGHAVSFFWNPMKCLVEARNQSAHGIFTLNIGGAKHNVISNPALVESALQQKNSDVSVAAVSWNLAHKFFGLPKKAEKKYLDNWKEIESTFDCLTTEPYLGTLLQRTIRNLEELIPQMVSFVESTIDQQPWEKYADVDYISNKEMEVDLMALVREIMGQASVPSLFGRAFLENNSHILHDISDMDSGIMYFLAGLPWWTPWPTVARAFFARNQAWDGVTRFQEALDASADGKHVDSSWGDLDDVSEFITKRHAVFKKAGIPPGDRTDLEILWALTINSSHLVYWHLLYILSTPSLLEEIIDEISTHVSIIPGVTIGSFTEAPKLHISHDNLSQKCPLFKSTYLEILRLSNQPWTIRQLTSDVTLTPSTGPSFHLQKNEFITIPHHLRMHDPSSFPSPSSFDPARFLSKDKQSVEIADSLRPAGIGESTCRGQEYAERECLAMVAGVLMYWEFEPVGEGNTGVKGKGKWKVPGMKSTSGVCVPSKDTRVRIKRRVV